MTDALALDVPALVDDDSGEVGPLAARSDALQRQPSADRRLLHRVLGIGGLAQHALRQPV